MEGLEKLKYNSRSTHNPYRQYSDSERLQWNMDTSNTVLENKQLNDVRDVLEARDNHFNLKRKLVLMKAFIQTDLEDCAPL